MENLTNGLETCSVDNCSDGNSRSWMVLDKRVSRDQQRKRSINAPEPTHKFGRKGVLMESSVHFNRQVDPSEHMLSWAKPAANVLIIKKIHEYNATAKFKELCSWLAEERRMVVHVESSIIAEPLVMNDESFTHVRKKLVNFKEGENLEDQIDFVICLGGDGTLLHASALFQQSCPPVMAFNLGSLGFLTAFKFDRFQEHITRVLDGHAVLTLRSRLSCITTTNPADSNDNYIKPNLRRHAVLNEVVIDRGPSSYLSNLEVYCNDHHITTVQGDGLIVSTPTGSTAYAVAAGASMVHPSVPAILVTPVCPHSLSFRPIILPAGVELKIVVSSESRNTAWASFDGRNRQELRQGERCPKRECSFVMSANVRDLLEQGHCVSFINPGPPGSSPRGGGSGDSN